MRNANRWASPPPAVSATEHMFNVTASRFLSARLEVTETVSNSMGICFSEDKSLLFNTLLLSGGCTLCEETEFFLTSFQLGHVTTDKA